MINLTTEANRFFLVFKETSDDQTLIHKLPIARDELDAIAKNFRTDLAQMIATPGSHLHWEYRLLRITPGEISKGRTKPNKRVRLFYHDKSWHLSHLEIDNIGQQARTILGINE